MKKTAFNSLAIPMLLCLGALAGLCALLGSCGSKSPAGSTEPALVDEFIPIQTALVQQKNIALPLHTSGILTSSAEQRLSFKIGGIIRKVYVDEGDVVRAGQLLASMDKTEIDAQVAQAQQGLLKAERDLARVEGLYRDSSATLELLQNATTGRDVAKETARIASFNRQYAEIRATRGGKIIKKLINEGEITGPGMPALVLFETGTNDWVVKINVSDRDWARLGLGMPAQIRMDAYEGVTFNGKVSELAPGDELEEGVVEGILTTVGEETSCFKIGPVVLSGSHLVLGPEGSWISANLHPDAVVWAQPPKIWYCLNTSTHVWKTKSGLVLRDWEELPDGHDKEWEVLIHELLNAGRMMCASSPGRGVLGGGTRVYEMEKGPVSLRSICIGDRVKDFDDTFVRVLGVYQDNEIAPVFGPNTAAWVWDRTRRLWTHQIDSEGPSQAEDSRHLVTESGTFVISGGIVVRDFTEVGIERLSATAPFVAKVLSRK